MRQTRNEDLKEKKEPVQGSRQQTRGHRALKLLRITASGIKLNRIKGDEQISWHPKCIAYISSKDFPGWKMTTCLPAPFLSLTESDGQPVL
jgi:hypothetical protein